MNDSDQLNETKTRLRSVRFHKVNTSTKSTDCDSPTKDFFLQKTQHDFIKKTLSPLKSRRDVLCNNTMKNGNVHSTLSRMLKTDIIQIDDLIKKLFDVIPHYITPAKPLHYFNGFGVTMNAAQDSHFQERLSLLQKGEDLSLVNYFTSIVENSKNLHQLYQDFGCQSKEELIMTLSMEIYLLELFLNKINDLAFLFNLKYNNEENNFMKNYNESLSKSAQFQILINKLIEKFDTREEQPIHNINVNKRGSTSSVLLANSLVECDENANDINKILETRTFHEFLNLETEDGVIKHIQSLFIKDNESSISILTNFILDRGNMSSKAVYVNKIKMSLRNNDNMENFVVIRKFLEESFNDLETKNRELARDVEAKVNEINKLQEIIQEINRRDYMIYIANIIRQNNTLSERLEDYERSGKEQLYEELKKKALKNTQLKQANDVLKKENEMLIEKLNILSRKHSSDEYNQLVQEQFASMQDSFVKERNKLIMLSKTVKQDYERHIAKLKDELKGSDEVKRVLMSRLEEIKNSFETLNFGINPLQYY